MLREVFYKVENLKTSFTLEFSPIVFFLSVIGQSDTTCEDPITILTGKFSYGTFLL